MLGHMVTPHNLWTVYFPTTMPIKIIKLVNDKLERNNVNIS